MALNIQEIINRITSHAGSLGVFDRVNSHEPKAAPGKGLTFACWVDDLRPAPGASGLDSTTVAVTLTARIYNSIITEYQDDIDPDIVRAADLLFTAFSADFDFGGNVRNVDLLGAFGGGLSARAGHITITNFSYRVIDITIPLIVNDVWTQEA
jgi:hypothetical protein